jgi:hypothetical protein
MLGLAFEPIDTSYGATVDGGAPCGLRPLGSALGLGVAGDPDTVLRPGPIHRLVAHTFLALMHGLAWHAWLGQVGLMQTPGWGAHFVS